jgi:hypothetical protein
MWQIMMRGMDSDFYLFVCTVIWAIEQIFQKDCFEGRLQSTSLPQNLFGLRQEYIEGIGGSMPARHFSFLSRIMLIKHFTASKILWDMISGFT